MLLNGLSKLALDYDLLLCDIWGVVHNGVAAYQPACEALKRFRAQGKIVFLLSNAPRPSTRVPEQLTALGVDPDQICDAIVTSGDVAQNLMREKKFGTKSYHIGPDRDLPLYDGHDTSRETDPATADFVLCSGLYDDTSETPEDYRELLQNIKAHALPMLCANPDRVVQRGENRIYCAGAIAQAYQALGGEVIYTGKPHQVIYKRALEMAQNLTGKNSARLRCLGIGDGPNTDILGANRAGIDVIFVTGGICADQFSDDPEDPDPGKIKQFLKEEKLAALAAMSRLVW